MTGRKLGTTLLFFVSILAVSAGCAIGAPPLETATMAPPSGEGLIVEDATSSSAAARAGIAPGDLLMTWERSASPPSNPQVASGRFRSPFDLTEVEVEEAPRGVLRITGLRQEKTLVWEIPPGPWELTTRPGLRGDQLREYQAGQASLAAGEVAAGLDRWRHLAQGLAEREPERAAWLWQRMAKVQTKNGPWTDARATYETALATVGPHSVLPVMSQLRAALADLLRDKGEIQEADKLMHQALDDRRAVHPGSLNEAFLLSGLARISFESGDLTAAQKQLLDCVDLRERLAPNSLAVSAALSNLGVIEHHLGNLQVAEDLGRQALEIDQRLLPDSLAVARDLTNLASLEAHRGDFADALDDQRRVLSLRERLAPDSLDVADTLQNIAAVLNELNDPAGASAALQRRLALQKRLQVDDLDLVPTLIGLGTTACKQHEFAVAERWLRQALAIQEKAGPGALDHAFILNDLADVMMEEGHLAEAEGIGRRALTMFHQVTPGTSEEATIGRDLAVILRREGRPEEARLLYEQALHSLESEGQRLFSSGQARSTFLAPFTAYYREDVDLLVELGRPEEAFNVLERYRARGLLELLAEHQLTFDQDVPADLEKKRHDANAGYERLLAESAALSDASPPKDREKLQTRIAEARHLQEAIREKIRAASPRLAALRDPEPLDLAATARALDPGTVLLSYLVGEEKSYAFVVGPQTGHFAVYPIKAGQKALGDEVHRLRNLIEQRGEAARPRSLLAAAGPLTSLLLAPAAKEIAAAQRLLVVPDGPLHVLPFAILADSGRPRFLIESKPVHTAASATVFAELKGHRETRPLLLSAFGDPAYPAPGSKPSTDLALRAAQRDGLRFEPLPGTRAEVESLGALFPAQSRLFLGDAATEEHAKTLGPETTIVHFACHAVLNERFPLDSALVLSIPDHPREGQDNGLLQAWEIFEQVHLNVDLVTLSACDSALGKELGGEGLIGLTRAFQYAGARSVLASLWGVGDAGTAELMKRFYGYLKTGDTKDEALRHAQADLLRGAGGSDLASPFYWAAFDLIGDWR